MATQISPVNAFFNIAQEKLPSARGNLRFYLEYVFKGVTFEDKSMLDVGAGIGLFSFYAASRGARSVVALEPEAAGSGQDFIGKFQELGSVLGLNQVTLLPLRFQDFAPDDEQFDILLLHNSINHLDEKACMELQRDPAAVQAYHAIFRRLYGMARPGAKIIIADCSRYNFFNLCGMRNPFAPSIEWQKHQPPQRWARLLGDAGFRKPEIRWTSFSRLGAMGRVLLGNRYAAYFLTSHFCLTAEK